MVDVADPLEPRFAGCFTHSAGGSPMAGMTHDAQCVAYAGPDDEHRGREVCLNSNFTGLMISDISDPAAPSTVAVGQYPGSALPHQGWLTEDHRYFLMGDEGDEIQGLVSNTRTLVWDLSDLDDPVVHAEYFHPTRAIDHNLYVRESLAYQANYNAGLRILDISDVEHIEEAGFFDTVLFGADAPRSTRRVERVPVLRERDHRGHQRRRGPVPAALRAGAAGVVAGAGHGRLDADEVVLLLDFASKPESFPPKTEPEPPSHSK